MKRSSLWITAFALIFTGCLTEGIVENGESTEKGSYTFSASFESNESRSYLGDDDYCYWEEGDKVSVFNASGTHYTYTSDLGEVKVTNLTPSTEPSFTDGEAIYALYPYQSGNSVSNDGTFTSTLPADQVYNKSNLSLNNAIMVASTTAPDTKFSFKNACALLMFELTTEDETVQVESISVTSLSKVNLAGTVTIGSDYTATVSSNGSTTVTLTGCAEAGTLSKTEAKKFLLVIPAGTYKSNDLYINIDTNNDMYDKKTLLTFDSDEFTVKRSEYIVIQNTLKENVLNIEENKTTCTAIMCFNELIEKQGFDGMTNIVHDYEIPDGDFTINGNYKTYNFVPDCYDGQYIYTSFTTKTSGIPTLTPGKITVNNLTITGTLRSTTMGIYVTPGKNAEYNPYCGDQSRFNTEWNNVKVIDNKIIPYAIAGIGNAEITFGSAVCVYGTANLNDCTVTGATQLEGTNYPTVPTYDMILTNRAKTTFNNSDIGKINGREHAALTVTNNSTVDLIDWNALYINIYDYEGNKFRNYLTINNNATVNTLNFNGYPGYYLNANLAPQLTIESATVNNLTIVTAMYHRITIKAGSKIGTLTFTDTTNAYLYNADTCPYGIKIEDDATIDKIIVGTEEMTLEQFKARVKE